MKNDMIHMYNIQNCCKNRDVKDRLILPQEFCLPQDKIRNLQKVHKLGKEMRWIFCRKKIRIKSGNKVFSKRLCDKAVSVCTTGTERFGFYGKRSHERKTAGIA